jgi:hypothetical protein
MAANARQLMAGESQRDQTGRRFDDFVPYLMIVFAFWIVSLVEWAQKIGGQNPDPRFWTLLSLLITAYGGFQVFRLSPPLRRPHPGQRDDGRVLEILERVVSKGFVIYNDLFKNDSDIDHLVVGPSGIYAIEMKVWNPFGSRTINYRDENELLVGGRITDGRALRHARDAVRALRLSLKEHLHQDYPLTGLIVFVGDWRVNSQGTDVEVPVITGDQLESYLEQQPPQLTTEQIAQICSHLERSGPS